MSVTVLDSDSSDSDIFIVKQIKPINKLTLQQALIIKHGVLHSHQVKNNVTSSHSKEKNKESISHGKKSKKKSVKSSKSSKSSNQKNLENSKNEKKRKVSTCSIENFFLKQSPEKESLKSSVEVDKKIVEKVEGNDTVEKIEFESWTAEEEMSDFITSLEKRKSDDESIKLSPGIMRKRKKFKVLDEDSSKSNKKSPSPSKHYMNAVKKLFDEEFPECESEINLESDKIKIQADDCPTRLNESASNSSSKNLLGIINLCTEVNEDKFSNNHELLSFCLKTIIKEEIEKQLDLEKNALKESKNVQKLISKKECEILERFLNLNDNPCKLLVRMLCRKRYWHRLSALNYKDISNDLKQEVKLLHQENFVDLNIWNEELSTQLDLLSKTEVQMLCKTFNMPFKTTSSLKKNEMISNLINNTKNQKSVVDMMQIKGKPSRMDLLKRETINCLGMCVRLNEKVVATFDKIMLLFSFPHYFDEENKRFSTQLFTRLRVFQNYIKYPDYKLSPTIVFETVFDFEQYEKALGLQDIFETAINTKRHEDFEAIKNKAKEEFKKLLNNEEYKKRISNLQSFLQKFSAGAVYARILTKYCLTFKRKSNSDEIIDIMQLLLNQNIFLKGKRGKWCEILVQAYENKKYNNIAAEILIKFLQDSKIDEVQKLTLQLRSQAILKKKTNSVDNSNLKETLDDLCTVSVQEPPSIEIKGKALKGSNRGSKCVYVEENENYKMYISVEERAILHYKSIGFTKGYHTEGFIIHSIFFLLFFDIIYGLSPPGVFQSSYQDAPLDFNSKYFYINRKDMIDSRLNEMCEWSEEELEAKLRDVYFNHFNTQCLITWKEDFKPELFVEFIKCLTMPILALICQRLVQNFRVFRSGFPDLTLWNPETKKCKFVEVKSPNDRLSPNQRVWLDFLRNIGVDCEVCNVKNTGSKSRS